MSGGKNWGGDFIYEADYLTLGLLAGYKSFCSL
jgi:hypothetical protein